MDEFQTHPRAEWRILKPGLGVNNGVLAGTSGVLFYDIKTNNYKIKTRVRGAGFAISVRTKPSGNDTSEGYYFSCWSDTCTWFLNESKEIPISPATAYKPGFVYSNFNDLEIEVNGRNLIARWNGEDFSTATDETFRSGGGVALYVYLGTEWHLTMPGFDAVQIIPLP